MIERNASVGSASTNKRLGQHGNYGATLSQAESGDIISLNSPPLHMEVQPPGSIESLNNGLGGVSRAANGGQNFNTFGPQGQQRIEEPTLLWKDQVQDLFPQERINMSRIATLKPPLKSLPGTTTKHMQKRSFGSKFSAIPVTSVKLNRIKQPKGINFQVPPQIAKAQITDYNAKFTERKQANTDTLRSRFHRYVTNSQYGSVRTNYPSFQKK